MDATAKKLASICNQWGSVVVSIRSKASYFCSKEYILLLDKREIDKDMKLGEVDVVIARACRPLQKLRVLQSGALSFTSSIGRRGRGSAEIWTVVDANSTIGSEEAHYSDCICLVHKSVKHGQEVKAFMGVAGESESYITSSSCPTGLRLFSSMCESCIFSLTIIKVGQPNKYNEVFFFSEINLSDPILFLGRSYF